MVGRLQIDLAGHHRDGTAQYFRVVLVEQRANAESPGIGRDRYPVHVSEFRVFVGKEAVVGTAIVEPGPQSNQKPGQPTRESMPCSSDPMYGRSKPAPRRWHAISIRRKIIEGRWSEYPLHDAASVVVGNAARQELLDSWALDR